MFVHIIPNEKFTEKFIDFIKIYYSSQNHKFYVHYDGAEFIKSSSFNVKLIGKLTDHKEEILRDCKDADKIFIHGFYRDNLLLFLFLYFRKYFSKTVLIIWGADLYNTHYFLQEQKGLFIRKHITEIFKKYIVKRTKYFMTFTYGDYDVISDWYKANGTSFDCLYPSTVNIELLTQLYNDYNSHDTVNILVGNSATKTNQHIAVFKELEKFKNNNIKVFCPLSYGDNEYAELIIKIGNTKFPNKFVPIIDYLSPDEYSRLLSRMDIAIFNHNRQQGTGNIEILGFLGVKIYLNSNTTTWEHYVNREKCSFFSFNDIKNIDFENFCHFDDSKKMHNHKYFLQIWDPNYIKNIWDKIIYYED